MRIIVNESQYNKILIKEKENTPTFDNWVNYMGDVLSIQIHKFNVKEDVNTHTNLSNKLRGKPFFKELPIENFIINLVENVYIDDIKISFNPYWSLLVETPNNYILKDIELDVELPSRKINGINEINIIKNQLRKEFIKINRWSNSSILLNEQDDNDYIPYTWDPEEVAHLTEFYLWDDAAEMNRFFNKVIGKNIHIIGGKDGNITIKDEFDLVEKKALELANTALSTPMYMGFTDKGVEVIIDKEKYEEEERLRAAEEARKKAEEEARLKAEEEARKKAEEEEARRTYLADLKTKNVYFINFDNVWGTKGGVKLGTKVIKGEYPIFEDLGDIPDDFHDYYKYAFINIRNADLNNLSDEEIMSDHPPEVRIYNIDVWEKNPIQFVQPAKIIKVKVKGSNGNLNVNNLQSIGKNTSGKEAYLTPEAAKKYIEMRDAAEAEGDKIYINGWV